MTNSDGDKRLKLMVGTPAYDGKVDAAYMTSLVQTIDALRDQIRFNVQVVSHDANVGHLRDMLVGMALDAGADALMWIDADQGWSVDAFMRVVMNDLDYVSGRIPLKGLPDAIAGRPLDDGEVPVAGGLVEMRYVGCGFTKVSRKCLEALWNGAPEYKASGWLERSIYAHGVVDGRYEGEDVSACRKWRELGGKVWLDLDAPVRHFSYWSELVGATRWTTPGDVA